MGHDWDDGSIKEKTSILARSLKTTKLKCTFVKFLADSLPRNEKTARGQDAKDLKAMAILANNFNSPKLQRAYADLIASYPRKRPVNTDDDKLIYHKKRKLQDTEWQCNECGKKLSNKSNLKRHLNVHTKNSKTQKQSDIEKAKAKIQKSTVADKKRTNIPKNTEKQKASVTPDSNYKCALCSQVCKAKDLYKHYGIVHNIHCPEEILFDNNNVLVYSDRYTEGGKAPWFIDQKKKFFDHYKAGTCKFCVDIEFDNLEILMLHYKADESMCGHNVDPSCLETIDHLFRAEKNAHLAGNIPQWNPKNTPRKNTAGNNAGKNMSCKIKIPLERLQDIKGKSGLKADIKVQASKQAQNAGLLMFVCECGVATEKYDSAVEHSQRHFVNCPEVPLTCDKCEFTFGVACHADHAARHQNNDISHDDFIQLKYDFAKLQSLDWFDMLKDLSPIHKDQIENTSIYKYTRNVKLNPTAISGVPVYQCAKCQLCIDPERVENHCNNGNVCLRYKRSGNICPICSLRFHSDNVLKAHKDDHKIGPPRLIMFNNKDDFSYNRALMKLKHIRRSTENVETPENKVTSARVDKNLKKTTINVISDTPVNRVCNMCNKHVNVSDYKAHTTYHEEEKLRRERELNKEPCLKNVGHEDHGNEIVTENVLHSEKHVNRQQETDSDSSQSAVHSIVVVNALMHEGEKHQKVALARNIPENTEQTSNREETIDETPEQLMLNLYDGIGSQTPLCVDEEALCTQELLITLGENAQERNSADSFVDDIMQENEQNASDARNGPHQAESDATTEDTNNETGRKGGSISSRDRLRIMLSENDSIEDDFIEDFEELNAKISQLIFSRD